MEKLQEWLKAKKMSQKEFARRVGVSNAAITRYLHGRIPEPEIMVRIYEVTHKKITPNDWCLK